MSKYIIVGAVVLVVLVVIVILLRKGRGDQSQALSSNRPEVDASSNASKLNWLVGRGGDVDGKTFHVGTRTVTIGRGVSNFVQTTDENASRVHCQLVPLPYGLQIKDMGSRNGTRVNGKKIDMHVLKEGDEIRIGEMVLQYKRQAAFRVDHGLKRKETGESAMKMTMMGEQMTVKKLAQNTLEEHDGDVPSAAAAMGVDPEVFLKMLG